MDSTSCFSANTRFCHSSAGRDDMVLMKDSRSVSCGCRDDDDDDDAPRVAAPQCIVNINMILSTLFADRKDDNYLSSKRSIIAQVLLPPQGLDDSAVCR